MVPVSAPRRLAAALASHLRDPLYLNGYALVANAGVGALLGFLFWFVAARSFPAEALGVGAAVVSAATLAALIGKAGFDAAIIRYAPSASPRGFRRLLAWSLVATVLFTALCGAVILLLAVKGIAALAPLASPWMAAGFLLLAAGTAGAWILDACFIAEQRALLVLARSTAFNVVKLAAPFLLVGVVAARVVPLAWGLGLAASVGVALAFLPRLLRRHEPVSREPLARREVGVYAARNFALNLSEFLPGLLLPILVLGALGPAANARFFLAWTVASVAFLASKAIAQSSFAALSRGGDPRGALRKAFLLSGLILGPFALVLLLAAAPLLRLFGPGYAESALLLKLLALSIPGMVVSSVFLSYLKARSKGWELVLLPAAGLAALLALLPFALSRLGVEGVGALWLLVQSAMGLYSAVRLTAALRRYQHENARPALRHRAHEG